MYLGDYVSSAGYILFTLYKHTVQGTMIKTTFLFYQDWIRNSIKDRTIIIMFLLKHVYPSKIMQDQPDMSCLTYLNLTNSFQSLKT